MSHQLWLQEARTVIDEPGWSALVDFSTDHSKAILDARRRGSLLVDGQAYYEPVGGHFCGHPDWTLSAMVASP